MVHRGPRHHRLAGDTMTCPADVGVAVQRSSSGGVANFGTHCAAYPLASRRTSSSSGRTIQIGPYEEMLARARTRQGAASWLAGSRSTRPKVEPSLAHLMRRRHGGRRARVRGRAEVNAAFSLLAATNLARWAVLGLHSAPAGWAAGERVRVAQEPPAGQQQRSSGPAAPPRPTAPPDPPSPLRCAAAVAVVTALLRASPARRFTPAT